MVMPAATPAATSASGASSTPVITDQASITG